MYNNYSSGQRDSMFQDDDWGDGRDTSLDPNKFSDRSRMGRDESMLKRRADTHTGGQIRSPSPLMSRVIQLENDYDSDKGFDSFNSSSGFKNQPIGGRMNETPRNVSYRNNQSSWNSRDNSNERSDMGRDSFSTRSNFFSQRNDEFRRISEPDSQINLRSNAMSGPFPSNQAKRARLSPGNSYNSDGFNRVAFTSQNSKNSFDANRMNFSMSGNNLDAFAGNRNSNIGLQRKDSFSSDSFGNFNDNRNDMNPVSEFDFQRNDSFSERRSDTRNVNFGVQRDDYDNKNVNFSMQRGNYNNRNNFGMQRDNYNDNRSNFGMQRDSLNDNRSNFGKQRDSSLNDNRSNFGMQRDNYNDIRSNFGMQRDNYNDNRSNFGMQRDSYNDNRSNFGSQRGDYNEKRNTNRMNSDFGMQRNNQDNDFNGNRNTNFDAFEQNRELSNPRRNYDMNLVLPNTGPSIGNPSPITPAALLLNSISGGLGLPNQNLPPTGNVQIDSPNAIFDIIASAFQLQQAKQTANLLENVVGRNFQKPNTGFNSGFTLDDVKSHTGPYGFMIVFYICQEHPLTTLSKTAAMFKKPFKSSFSFNEAIKMWIGKIHLDGKLLSKGKDKNAYKCKLKTATEAVDKLRKLYFTILMTQSYGGSSAVDVHGKFVSRRGKLAGAMGVQNEKQLGNNDDAEDTQSDKPSHDWHVPVKDLNKLKQVITDYRDDITNINDLVFTSEIPGKERIKLEIHARLAGLAVEKGGGRRNRYLVVSKKNDIMSIVYNLVEINKNQKNSKYRLLQPGQDLRSIGIPLNKIEFQANPKKLQKGEKKDEERKNKEGKKVEEVKNVEELKNVEEVKTDNVEKKDNEEKKDKEELGKEAKTQPPVIEIE